MFLSCYGNTSGSLGEQEMLWVNEPTEERFHSFFKFSKTSTSFSLTQRNTMNICSTGISLRKQCHEKRKQFVYFNYQQVNSLCLQHHNIIISSFKNTSLNQSAAHILSYGCFLKLIYREMDKPRASLYKLA